MPNPPVLVAFRESARIESEPQSQEHANGDNEKAAPEERLCATHAEGATLFDFAFLEDDMLARHRIVFLELELFRLGARVFLGHVKVTRVRRAHELDLNRIAFSHNSLPFRDCEED
jgi:hypothetical protein